MYSWNGRREVGGVGGRAVDVLVAEHLAADLHAGLVAGSSISASRCSRISCGDRVGPLDVDQVRAGVEHLEARAGDRAPRSLGVLGGRRRRVLRAARSPASARRCCAQVGGQVHVLDDRAAARVALVVDADEHLAQPRRCRAVAR